MTSRERLLTALRGARPDRTPVTIYELSPYADDWAAGDPSYAPLLELERQWGDSFVFTPGAFPVFFDEQGGVREKLTTAADGTTWRTRELDTPRGPLRAVSRRPPDLMTWWQVEPLIKTDADLDRVLALPDPRISVDAAAIRAIEQRTGDAGVLCFNPGDALGRVVDLFRFEDFVLRAHRDDAPIRALLARANAQLITAVRAHAGIVRDAAFRLWGPEYSGAPLMNPRRYFQPYVVAPDRDLTAAIHETGNLSIVHCHGRLAALLEPITDIGADALEPLEALPIATADVTLDEIFRRAGDRLCLMGGIQAQVLEHAPPAEMEAHVRNVARVAAEAGAFVILPTAAPFMRPLTPRCLQNAEIMYRVVRRETSRRR